MAEEKLSTQEKATRCFIVTVPLCKEVAVKGGWALQRHISPSKRRTLSQARFLTHYCNLYKEDLMRDLIRQTSPATFSQHFETKHGRCPQDCLTYQLLLTSQ